MSCDVDAAVQAALKSRAAIEQAKGILMVTYGISADRAFELLKWRSQESNIPVRKLAAQIVADFTIRPLVPPRIRDHADHLLLTAHERVPMDETDDGG